MPRRRVGLLGAAGYTGRLVAAELAARGIDTRLGARSAGDVDPDLPGERVSVDVTDHRALLRFCDGVDVVVNTVGPFAPLAGEVVHAAAETGTAYVDCGADPAHLRKVYSSVRRTPAPIVPGCGFYCMPGDLAAAVAAEHFGGPVETVEVHYSVRRMVPSRGTARDGAEAFGDDGVGPARLVRFPHGVEHSVEVPWGEQVMVRRHVPGATVTTTLALPAAHRLVVGVLPRAVPLLDRLPVTGPPPAVRRQARFTVLVLATGAGGERSAVAVVGRDVFGITARLLALASQAVAGEGPLAPAEAMEPEALLDAARGTDERGELEWAYSFPDARLDPE